MISCPGAEQGLFPSRLPGGLVQSSTALEPISNASPAEAEAAYYRQLNEPAAMKRL